MTNVLGISGKLQSGKSACVKALIANELNEQGFKARLNEKGDLLVVTDVDTMTEGILDIESKRPDIMGFLEETVWPYIKNYSFADPLKDIAVKLFGLTHEQVYGTNEDKNSLTNLYWENMPGIITKDYGTKLAKVEKELTVKYHTVGQMTAREVMQYIGSMCRRIYNDCWVNFTLNRIQSENVGLAVIQDVRYQNEVEGIQKVGGKVVRLTRQIDTDTHNSEIDLDNYNGFDAIIDNQNMSVADQVNELMNILIKFGFYQQK